VCQEGKSFKKPASFNCKVQSKEGKKYKLNKKRGEENVQ
jgi:hypothetical protein